jgi:hypothetical protein
LFQSQQRLKERYDPAQDLREMGTSYYKFSHDDARREKEKKELEELHEQASVAWFCDL